MTSYYKYSEVGFVIFLVYYLVIKKILQSLCMKSQVIYIHTFGATYNYQLNSTQLIMTHGNVCTYINDLTNNTNTIILNFEFRLK